MYEQPRALGTHEEGGGRDWHPASIAGLRWCFLEDSIPCRQAAAEGSGSKGGQKDWWWSKIYITFHGLFLVSQTFTSCKL